MRKLVTLLLLCVFIFSCDKENTTRTIYFQVDISPEFITNETEDWIVIHDRDNHLLSAKRFEAGERIVFDSTVIINEPFIVTNFRRTTTTIDHFAIESYNGITPGEEWILKPVFPSNGADYGTDLGNHELTISDPNLGNSYNTMMSNKYQEHGSPAILPDGSLKFTSPVTTTVDDYFVFAADKNANPKYAFLENLAAGAKQTLALSDMKDFDKVINVTLPGQSVFTYAFVRSYENGQPYVVADGYFSNFYLHGISGGAYSSYKLGYLNRFNTHVTVIHGGFFPTYDVTYESYGPAPTGDITLTKANIELVSKTFLNLSINGSDFSWRKSNFYTNSATPGPRIDWLIFSGKDDLKNYSIPVEFTKRFASYNSTDLVHSNTSFSKGISFSEFLDEKFKTAPRQHSIVTTTTLK